MGIRTYTPVPWVWVLRFRVARAEVGWHGSVGVLWVGRNSSVCMMPDVMMRVLSAVEGWRAAV